MPGRWLNFHVCRNGHITNDDVVRQPLRNARHCSNCGESTMTTCEKCGAVIQGRWHPMYAMHTPSTTTPAYCHNCGARYPWTERKLQAMRELVEQAEGLQDDERQALQEDLEELVSDTPAAVPAAKRAGKLTEKILEPTKALLYQFAVDVASEAAIKAMRGY